MKLIKVASIMILFIISCLLFSSCSNDKIVYGDYIYVNEKGTKEMIILSENSVICKNVDFTTAEKNTAFFQVYDKQEQLKSEGKKMSNDDFFKLQEEYMKKLDFDSLFQNKESDILEMEYDKDLKQYYFYVSSQDSEDVFLDFYYNLKDKTLIMENTNFNLVK